MEYSCVGINDGVKCENKTCYLSDLYCRDCKGIREENLYIKKKNLKKLSNKLKVVSMIYLVLAPWFIPIVRGPIATWYVKNTGVDKDLLLGLLGCSGGLTAVILFIATMITTIESEQ